MKFQQLVSHLAKMEGKKKQVSVGNIREVLKCLVGLEAASRIQHEKLGISDLSALADPMALLSSQAKGKAELYKKREGKKPKSLAGQGLEIKKLRA